MLGYERRLTEFTCRCLGQDMINMLVGIPPLFPLSGFLAVLGGKLQEALLWCRGLADGKKAIGSEGQIFR